MDEARRIQIGGRLKELRKAAALTQEQLADRAGVVLRTYQDWEYGHSGTDLEQYEKLAEVFGVPVSEILGTPNGEPVWVGEIKDQLARILDRLDLLEAELVAAGISRRSESDTPQAEEDADAATGQ